jgi:hypothetical protein
MNKNKRTTWAQFKTENPSFGRKWSTKGMERKSREWNYFGQQVVAKLAHSEHCPMKQLLYFYPIIGSLKGIFGGEGGPKCDAKCYLLFAHFFGQYPNSFILEYSLRFQSTFNTKTNVASQNKYTFIPIKVHP